MEIIGSIIVAGFALIGTIVTSIYTNKKTQSLINYRIEQLEDKVNKHNNLVERMYKLEERVTILEKEGESK